MRKHLPLLEHLLLLLCLGVASYLGVRVATAHTRVVYKALTMPAPVSAQAYNPLPDTSANIHLGFAFDASSSPAAEAANTPPVDFMWGSSFPGAKGSTHRTFYMFLDLDQNQSFYNQAQPLSWYLAHHPDWIEYSALNSGFTCSTFGANISQATADSGTYNSRTGQYIAYETGTGNNLPIDTANPGVRAYMEQTWIRPALTGTLVGATDTFNWYGKHFDGVNFDVLELDQNFASSGERCGHYAFNASGCPSPGVYTAATGFCQQYTAGSNDTNFMNTETNTAAAYTAYIRSNFPGASATYNFSYNTTYPTASNTLLAQIPVDLDEAGITACGSGCGSIPTGATWTTWATGMATYLNSAAYGGPGWVFLNDQGGSVTGCTLPTITHAQSEWALGNYLLLKNNHSYFWQGHSSNYGCIYGSASFPEYAAQIGYAVASGPCASITYCANWKGATGVYGRDFGDTTNGPYAEALVNPAAAGSVTVTLPVVSGGWTDIYGASQGATVSVGAQSGLILLHATAPGAVPTPTGVPVHTGPRP